MLTKTITTTASILIAAVSVALAQTNATYEFISSEMTIDGKTVKGQPYSAEAVTETTQALADGNRIARKTNSSIYRDSEGRTRREQSLPSIGPWSTSGQPIRTVLINDPVAGTAYTLNENDKTAHKMPFGMGAAGFAMAADKMTAEAEFHAAPMPGTISSRHAVTIIQRGIKTDESSKEHALKTEDLGTQNIEGVPAKGTRSTVTIPAGEIGNDKPIEIVDERWYSSELSMVVMTKHLDPRMGETVYKLTHLQRSEPSKILFQVPADFKLVDSGDRIMMRKLPEPNKDAF